MSDKSKIEWTDATWNPVTGCTKVSEGCRNCYALKFAERWRGTPGHYFEKGFDITLRPDKLDQPLKWKRPRRIFVNSMSDLFHDGISWNFILKAFEIMKQAHWHTFQLLTKRPERMLRMTQNLDPDWRLEIPQNVWIGVSVENQKAADERIPLLLQTPAAVRFLSCEPLLGPVDLNNVSLPDGVYWDALDKEEAADAALEGDCDAVIDWVIVGGESGPGARPMHPEWLRSLRDQCQDAGVPFFFKQWGEWLPNAQEYGANPGDYDYEDRHEMVGDIPMARAGKKDAGRMIDGRTWDQMPLEEAD